jgi:hypothetical protein
MRNPEQTIIGKQVRGMLAVFALIILTVAGKSVLPSPRFAGRVVPAPSNMCFPRSGHTATLLPSGLVLIVGGMHHNGEFYSSAEQYDPRLGSFSPLNGMAFRRVSPTATLLPNGKVLIAGGSSHPYDEVAVAELYDPSSHAFTATGHMVVPRGGATAALLPNGKVLIAGGEQGTDETKLASAELYDPATGTFTLTGSMHVPRVAHALTLLKNGTVLVTGGLSAGRYSTSNEVVEASAELYDPATGRFRPTGPMTVPRCKHASEPLADGRVIVVGGATNGGWRGQYSTAEIYDPPKGTFAPAGNMEFERFKLTRALVLLKNGKVLVAGGAEHPEVYDPVTGVFHPVAGAIGNARYFSTATLLQDGTVLIAGGYGTNPGEGSVPQAWLYQP